MAFSNQWSARPVIYYRTRIVITEAIQYKISSKVILIFLQEYYIKYMYHFKLSWSCPLLLQYMYNFYPQKSTINYLFNSQTCSNAATVVNNNDFWAAYLVNSMVPPKFYCLLKWCFLWLNYWYSHGVQTSISRQPCILITVAVWRGVHPPHFPHHYCQSRQLNHSVLIKLHKWLPNVPTNSQRHYVSNHNQQDRIQ